MKKLLYLVGLMALLIVGVAYGVKYMNNDTELSSDEPPFNTMSLPPQMVCGSIYMDGGSVWVGVVDRNGKKYDLAFPYDHRSKGYPTAFHGVMNANDPAAKPLSNPVRARSIALGLLVRFGGQDEGVATAYDYLSGKNRSVIRRIQREGIRGIFE